MADKDRIRWNQRYQQDKWGKERQPNPRLLEYAQTISGRTAIDVACGPGQNSLWLAQQGFLVVGIDISRRALDYAVEQARQRGLSHHTLFVEADFDTYRLPPACADLLINFRFLDRSLFSMIRAAIRPGGFLLFETLNWRWASTHPDVSPEHLLQPGELLSTFQTWRIISHQGSGETSTLFAQKI